MRFIVSLLTILMLVGCTSPTKQTDKKDLEEITYDGDQLSIGITGSESLPIINNVKYIPVSLESLKPHNKELDALIITKESFEEADKEEYVKFYNEVEYPVFFYGIDGFKLFAFTKENMNMENSRDDNSAFIQGFKHNEGRKLGFQIYKEEITDKEMLIRAFNFIIK